MVWPPVVMVVFIRRHRDDLPTFVFLFLVVTW